MGDTTSGQVVFRAIRKHTEQDVERKVESSTLPQSLPQFLPPDSCLKFPALMPLHDRLQP